MIAEDKVFTIFVLSINCLTLSCENHTEQVGTVSCAAAELGSLSGAVELPDGNEIYAFVFNDKVDPAPMKFRLFYGFPPTMLERHITGPSGQAVSYIAIMFFLNGKVAEIDFASAYSFFPVSRFAYDGLTSDATDLPIAGATTDLLFRCF